MGSSCHLCPKGSEGSLALIDLDWHRRGSFLFCHDCGRHDSTWTISHSRLGLISATEPIMASPLLRSLWASEERGPVIPVDTSYIWTRYMEMEPCKNIPSF